MNKRRVVGASFLIGAAAAVARRLRKATDPGVSVAPSAATDVAGDTEPAVSEVGPDETGESVAAVSEVAPDVAGDSVAAVSEVGSEAVTDVTSDEDVSLGDPDIELPTVDDATGIPVDDVELGEPELDTDVHVPGVPDDTEGENSPASSGEPQGNEPDTERAGDGPPRIVLPTMPQAGTSGTGHERAAETSAEKPEPESEPGSDSQASRLSGTDGATSSTPTDDAGAIPSGRPMSRDTAMIRGQSAVSPGTDLGSGAGDPANSAGDQFEPTQTPDFPAAPASPERNPRAWYRRRGWRIAGALFGALLIGAVIAASVVELPYYSLRPGSVYDTIERVQAPGDLVTIPNGEISFVTVSQTANITPWQWLDAKLDGNVRIRHEDEVRGDQTPDELREADIRRMQVSKDAAVVVALGRLGYDLVVTPIGIEVAQVFPCTAADGTLGTGDLIVGVNGEDVRDGESLIAALAEIGIGEDVELLVERIDPTNPTQSMRTDLVTLTLGSADASCLPDDVRAEEPRAFIGIGTLTIVDEEFPIDIDVDTGSVGGPSAGLAFTLAIMDVLSEGDLTNGLSIVATGTIDRDGNVGPVGGIQQKTVAAERSGADLFIVPACCDNFVSNTTGEPLDIPSNYDEALQYAGDMTVIGVNTLDEALLAIGELGGDVDQFLTP